MRKVDHKMAAEPQENMKVLLEVELDVKEFDPEVVQRVVRQKLTKPRGFSSLMLMEHKVNAGPCEEGFEIGKRLERHTNLNKPDGRDLKKEAVAHAEACAICTYSGRGRHFSNVDKTTFAAHVVDVRLVS